MQISQDCLALIKKWEGLHKKLPDGSIAAYADPVGIWTIGYGSITNPDLGRPVQPGDVITEATAARWLEDYVKEAAEDVDRLCQVPITQSMFDALVSFVYNVGIGAFGESTLLRKLNAKDYEGAAREFDRWVKAGGSVLPGLVNRRNDEEALFRRDGLNPTGVAGTTTAPEPLTSPSAAEIEEQPYAPAPLPLPITQTLSQGSVGPECYILNCALAGLGFLRIAPQPNQFSDVTKAAIELFQRREAIQVDGKVGPETRRALENALKRARGIVPPIADTVFCRLTRTGAAAYEGLERLKLEFVAPGQGILDSLPVVSGQPGRQLFLLPNHPDSVAGSLQPIPQGRYSIGDIDWAGGKDNYTASHGSGFGPIWVALTAEHRDDRGDFGLHADWNWITQRSSPGSAGCVCPGTIEDLKKLVSLLRQYDPRVLVVNWGL